MSSTPEPAESGYSPTDPGELLARAKRRSLAIRRHRLIGASGSLAIVAALALGGVVVTSRSGSPGRVVVSDRIGSAYEMSASGEPSSSPPAQVVTSVENSEVAFSTRSAQPSRELE